MELDLFRQMCDLFRTQLSAALQVPCNFQPDLMGPFRSVEPRRLREAQQRIAH